MKSAKYILPFLTYTACSSPDPTISEKIEEVLTIDFEPYAWSLDWKEMKSLRELSSHLPSGAIISLETCVGGEGNTEYFRVERTKWVEYFLTHNNPLNVQVSRCDEPDPYLAEHIYVSVAGEYNI